MKFFLWNVTFLVAFFNFQKSCWNSCYEVLYSVHEVQCTCYWHDPTIFLFLFFYSGREKSELPLLSASWLQTKGKCPKKTNNWKRGISSKTNEGRLLHILYTVLHGKMSTLLFLQRIWEKIVYYFCTFFTLKSWWILSFRRNCQ